MSTSIGKALTQKISAIERGYSSEGAVDGSRTMTRIRRRRAGTLAGTVTAALVGVGLLATLGVTLARNTEPISSPDGSIEVPLIVDSVWAQVEGELGLSQYCGEPPPQVAPITEQFTLTAQVASLTDDLSTDLQFFTGGELASEDGVYHTERPDILNLATRVDAAGGITPGWLFVQDGVVVGYVDRIAFREDLPTGLRVWTNGGSTSLSANTAVAISCSPDGGPRWDPAYMDSSTILPAGEYEAYPIMRISTSLQFDALHALATQGLSLWVIGEDGIGSPGSWDCQQAIESTGLTPINCVEGLYNASTGVATITVPPELQSPSLHVTLVGAPIPYTRTGVIVERDWFETEAGDEPSPSPTYVSEFDMCTLGQKEIFWPEPGSPLEPAHLTGSAVIDPLLTGASVTTDLRIIGERSLDGELSDAVDLGVRLLVFPDGMESFDVGYARATINEGAPIVLDRFSGPTTVTLTIGDVTWCGQPPPEGVGLSAVIDGSATFTPTAGDERGVRVILWITQNWDLYY